MNNNYLIKSRHIFCNSLWMEKLKGASVTLLSSCSNQDEKQEEGNHTIEELVDFTLNVQRFNLASTNTNNKNEEEQEEEKETDIRKQPKVLAAGEIDISFRGIEIHYQNTNSVENNNICKIKYDEIESVAKYSVLRPSSHLRSPYQHFAVLEIKVFVQRKKTSSTQDDNNKNQKLQKLLLIGSSYHSTSLLFDSAMTLWKRQNDIFDSELHRALFKSRPVDEALSIIASMPFEAFGTVTSKSGGVNTLMTKTGFRQPASTTGTDQNGIVNNSSSSKNNNLLNDDSSESSSSNQQQRDVRIEISPDGILQLWLLPKDFHSMKYDDLQFYATATSNNNNTKSNNDNTQNNLPLPPSARYERFPKCVYDLSTLIDCRLTNNSDCAIASSSSGGGAGNGEDGIDESVSSSPIGSNNKPSSTVSGTTGASSSSTSAAAASTLDRINKESSRILAATANEQIQQHFDDLELLSAESVVNSSSDEVKVSENTINNFKKRVSYLFLVFPDSTALTIKMQYQPTLDSGSTAQQHPHLYNPLFSSSRHLTHSSITDIFYACCAARPWLQPALNNHHQLYSVETDIKEEKSSSSIKRNAGGTSTTNTNTNARKINLENLIPGAIQPFTRKEIAQCHDRYNSIQRDIARMCILKVAKSSSSSSSAAAATMMKNSSVSSSSSSFNNNGNVMIAQVYNTYPNTIRNGGSSSLDQPPSLGAITLSDIPIIFKHSLIPRNSESSHDVFMRNVLECCFTCCYTNICTQPQLMPEFMRSLNFSDFLFATYILERGGVNLRMMMVYGGIVRSFFHRSSSNSNKSLLTAANHHQIMLDEIHQQQQGKDESKTKTKSASSSTIMSFDLSTFKRVLKTLQSAKTQNIYNQQQHQSHNNLSSSPYHENNSTFLISATQAAKKVEGDAEILWQCALATYGQDTWENKMPAFAQFIGLIKISHDLQISLLQDFEELLKNSSDGSIVIEKKKRGDYDHDSPLVTTTTTTIRTNNICPSTNSIAIGPGHPKFFEVLLLYQGIHMSLHSYASSSSSSPSRNSNNKNIPDYAWDSPAESPRNHGEDYSYSNDYFGESFYNDDDDDEFYSTPSRKSRKPSPSRNSNNNNVDETKIDKKQIENRLSEKTVYDLSKNKVRNTVLGGENNNNNNNSPSTNNNKQDDYPNNVTSTATKQEQGEASFFSKLVSRLTLQTVYHGTFFTDYAESYFSQIRHEFGVSDQELWNAVALPKVKSSLCFANFSGVHSLLSSGKSKSLLSRSHDGRFIFKELPKHEVAVLRRILPAYLAHIRKYPNNTSLLPRYLALYKIAEYRDSHDAYTFIVVIENIFARAERSIDAVYDLKGSLVGRESEKNFLEKGVAAKDHQFVIDPNRGPICLPAKFRDSILRQLFLDVQFLKQLNATDYSLLVGVHTVENVQDETKYQNRRASSASARGLAQLLGGDDYSVKSGRVRENDDDENENENENSSSSSSTSSDYYEDENDIDDEIQEAADFNKDMEECPVHRVMNYCQEEISSSGMMVMRNNFFGGLPAFSQGHYVERVNDEKNRLRLPSGCQWPNESSPAENQTDNSKGRRFNKTNPKFQLSSKLMKKQEQNQVTSSSSQHQQKLSEIVYIGLVDTLTEYDWRKKAEFVAKGYLLMKDMDNVSCAPASEYASRFLNFMAKDVFVPAVEM